MPLRDHFRPPLAERFVEVQKLIRELGLSLDGNPIYYRTNTDDLEFVSDVLVKKEYGCAGRDFGNPEVIVDWPDMERL